MIIIHDNSLQAKRHKCRAHGQFMIIRVQKNKSVYICVYLCYLWEIIRVIRVIRVLKKIHVICAICAICGKTSCSRKKASIGHFCHPLT